MRVRLGIPLGRSTDDDRTPPSLPASIKEIQKEEHSGKACEEAKALGKSHELVGKIYKTCYSSTAKRSGATVEDINPEYPHGGPRRPPRQEVGRADYSWRGTSRILAPQDIQKLPTE